MKIIEIVDFLVDFLLETTLFEMAFQRKVIINLLRSLQFQINRHAIKIILWPESISVPHWKSELIAWGNELTSMMLRARHGVRPLGFDLAWKHLYQEPFEPSPNEQISFLARIVSEECQCSFNKPLIEMVIEMTQFLRAFCQAIGSQHTVDEIVNTLGK